MKWISLGQLYKKKLKKLISQKSVWDNFIKKINFSKIGPGQLCKKIKINFLKIDLGQLYKKSFEQVKKAYKTPLGETGCLGNSYFTGCLSIQFFNSSLPLTQSVMPPMAT